MKMPSILKITCSLIALAVAPVVVTAAVLDQSFQPSSKGHWISAGPISDGRALAQTFTVGVSGNLTRFDTYITDAGGGFPVLWDIRPTMGGAPVESVGGAASLASGTFLSSAARSWGFFSVDLSSSLTPVFSGEVLAIVFRTAPGYAGVSISWLGEKPDFYTSGAGYVGQPGTDGTSWSTSFLTGYDMGFKTYVEPVPEPSSAFLVILGAGVILGTRVPLRRFLRN